MSTNISSSSQDYLEAILELSEGNEGVRVTDIANKLGIKKASVTQAINILAEEDLVSKERYGPIYLTEKGEKEAERVKIMHSLLKYFFEKILGVPAEPADNDACRIEHSLSRDTFLLFAEFLNKQGLLKEYGNFSKLQRILCDDQERDLEDMTLCQRTDY